MTAANDRRTQLGSGGYSSATPPVRAGARADDILPSQRRRGLGVPGLWLALSMAALGLVAAAAAIVSYSAQYRMVYATKRAVISAALEAGIPDVAALIFAGLGIGLALHGRRALRPRTLNVCAVATSVAMNLMAAGHGWRDLAIWAMPPIAYALASDTASGVVRAWTIARQRAPNEALADEGTTPLAIVGGLLWMLRLGFAPASTLAGLRRWVTEECPFAPGRRAHITADVVGHIASRRRAAITSGSARSQPKPRKKATAQPTKTDRFLDLVTERYGPLAQFPTASVSRVCTELAPEVDLNVGSARTPCVVTCWRPRTEPDHERLRRACRSARHPGSTALVLPAARLPAAVPREEHTTAPAAPPASRPRPRDRR